MPVNELWREREKRKEIASEGLIKKEKGVVRTK